MLYSEFIEGTNCKDTAYNYNVYKTLEGLYMSNDKLTKADIYDAGKKLVDNSKTEKQIEFEKKINAEIDQYENWIKDTEKEIAYCKELIARHSEYLKYCTMTDAEKTQTKKNIDYWRQSIKNYKSYIDGYRKKVTGLKWVLK